MKRSIWHSTNGEKLKALRIKGINEDLILMYISNKSKKFKPSSLWAQYSMLKSTLLVKENVDVGKYVKVIAFLKRTSVGYHPKKSKILSKDDIDKFVKNAPNETYLMIKVAMIFGVVGACRREELCHMSVEDIEDRGSVLIVRIPQTKTHTPRTFTVISDGESFNPLELYHHYASLRPKNVNHGRFFLTYRKGKCTVQPVGITSFAKFPNLIATYLGLENPNLFTGHCFRRSSATLLADAGANVMTLKRHGGWKSASVAESYVDDSLNNKIKIARSILNGNGGESASVVSTSFANKCTSNIISSTERADVPGSRNVDISRINSISSTSTSNVTLNVEKLDNTDCSNDNGEFLLPGVIFKSVSNCNNNNNNNHQY